MKFNRRLLVMMSTMLAAFVLAVFLFPVALRLADRDGRLVLPVKAPYSSGHYYVFGQPWGAENSRVFRFWGKKSESIWIDTINFPNNTRINWAWPPFQPPNNVGVWGYHHLGYGNYDGGDPEKLVQPRRVDDLQALRVKIAWDGDFTFGQSTILTEFYLRRDPRNNESKQIEIGWLLHMAPQTVNFVSQSKQLGMYVDPQGRRWRVAKADKYLTLSPADGKDVRQGVIDMRHALLWLKSKNIIRGDEWLTGLAAGAEPIKGFGHVNIRQWQVDFR